MLHWSNNTADTIRTSHLNGTGVATLVPAPAAARPRGVAVNSSHLYWASTNNAAVMAANLDGTGMTTLVTGQSAPDGVALSTSHIYWTSAPGGMGASGSIRSASLTGTGEMTLVTGQFEPIGLAVNSSHIYWTDFRPGTIMAANLDGTGVETLVTGQEFPYGLAVGQGVALPSSTNLTATPSRQVPGAPVALTSRVSCPTGSPTGTVTFRTMHGVLGSAALVNGVAMLTAARLPLGVHVFTAAFGGDSDCAASQSDPVTVTIVRSPAPAPPFVPVTG